MAKIIYFRLRISHENGGGDGGCVGDDTSLARRTNVIQNQRFLIGCHFTFLTADRLPFFLSMHNIHINSLKQER